MIRKTVEAAAARAAKQGVQCPVVLAVTVLTSLNNSDLAEIGFEKTTNDLVLHLAKMAQKAGASGVVASPLDIVNLRRDLGKDFVIVTPGIRSADEQVSDDQKERSAPLKRFRRARITSLWAGPSDRPGSRRKHAAGSSGRLPTVWLAKAVRDPIFCRRKVKHGGSLRR